MNTRCGFAFLASSLLASVCVLGGCVFETHTTARKDVGCQPPQVVQLDTYGQAYPTAFASSTSHTVRVTRDEWGEVNTAAPPRGYFSQPQSSPHPQGQVVYVPAPQVQAEPPTECRLDLTIRNLVPNGGRVGNIRILGIGLPVGGMTVDTVLTPENRSLQKLVLCKIGSFLDVQADIYDASGQPLGSSQMPEYKVVGLTGSVTWYVTQIDHPIAMTTYCAPPPTTPPPGP